MFRDKLKKVINSNDHESNGGNDKKKIENFKNPTEINEQNI